MTTPADWRLAGGGRTHFSNSHHQHRSPLTGQQCIDRWQHSNRSPALTVPHCAVSLVSGCVGFYTLTTVDGSLTAISLRSVRHLVPSSIAAAATSLAAGSVECIAYCPSTSTLAVARRVGGIQLLDSNGEQSGALVGSWPVHSELDGTGTGADPCSAVCWSSDGFSLLANSVPLGVRVLPGFSRHPVLHVPLLPSATKHASRSLLLGADRLLLSTRTDSGFVRQSHATRKRAVQRSGALQTSQLPLGSEPAALSRSSVANPDEVDTDGFDDDETAELSAEPLLSSSFDCLLSDWDAVQLPPAYASHACPIRCVSVSESGEHVAVAGSRGLCVWTRRTRKWRQMTSLREEWTLRPQHIAWLADHAIVVHSRDSEQNRRQWKDSVQRARQCHVHPASNGADDRARPQWTLSSSSVPLARSSVSSSTFQPSPLVSDMFVFPRSHLSFSAVLCAVSFPVGCRVSDMLLVGSSLFARTADSTSLLIHLKLYVSLPPSSRPPHRVSASFSSTHPLPSPSAPSPELVPLSQPRPTLSNATVETSSPLLLPSSVPASHTTRLADAAPSSASPSHSHSRLRALLPPSWDSSVRSTISASASGSVLCSLREVQQLPVELVSTGLHRSALQMLYVPHALPLLSTTSHRPLLLLLSVTGDLHVIALAPPGTAAGSAASHIATTAATSGSDSDSGSVSWLAARHVSAVWTQPTFALSSLSAAALEESSGSQNAAGPPLLLAFGVHGLRLIQPQSNSSAQPSSQLLCSVTLPAGCYPAGVDWRTGSVRTLRFHRSQQDEPSSASAPLLTHALSLHSIPFLQHLLSACLPSVPSTAPASPPSPALLGVAICLLRCCVDVDSTLLALELFVHSELVGEECRLAAWPAPHRSSRVAIVHSLLRTVAGCLSTLCVYERVLAHVARKTDSSLWARLFQLDTESQYVQVQRRVTNETERNIAGSALLSPTQLAAACIARRQLHTATLYLLLVQRTDSPLAAHLLAVQLLREMERGRQAFASTAGSRFGEFDELESELQLDSQVRRFAQQTAAIIREQSQQVHRTRPHDTASDANSHSAPLTVRSAKMQVSLEDKQCNDAPPISYDAAEAISTRTASPSSAKPSGVALDAGGNTSCALQ